VRLQVDRRPAVLRRNPRGAVNLLRAARLGALCGILALSGCSWMPSLPAIHSPFSSAPGEPCPTTVILHPLRNTAVFPPGERLRPENVAFYGIFDDVSSKCEYSGGDARVALDVVVIGQRGPAAKSDAVDFDYFVAVTGPGGAILSKKPFSVHIALPQGRLRAGVSDHIEETIPLGGRKPNEFEIVLGFQQSPEVVYFYKHFRGR
jgi:hypothetical protein